jgi:hypothetical protein
VDWTRRVDRSRVKPINRFAAESRLQCPSMLLLDEPPDECVRRSTHNWRLEKLNHDPTGKHTGLKRPFKRRPSTRNWAHFLVGIWTINYARDGHALQVYIS